MPLLRTAMRADVGAGVGAGAALWSLGLLAGIGFFDLTGWGI